MTPQNKTQTTVTWIGTVLSAVLLAFLTSLARELPGTEPINWRGITLDVISALIPLVPVIIAGLVLPRFGAEKRAVLIDKIGKEEATQILETAAEAKPQIDMEKLAIEILNENERRLRAKQSDRRETITSNESIP